MPRLVLEVSALSRPWSGVDPFLFCAYHVDHYPVGDGELGVSSEMLADRPLGSDFSAMHGFSMYFGHSVPGFPSHPHRGFETITIVRSGYVDHADSLGAQARYGVGDVQWLTAGAGIQHSEMFPLLHTNKDNPLELFQIWLNLPARSKFVSPAFKMLWAEEIPHLQRAGADVTVIAGNLHPTDGSTPLTPVAPPPDSWGAQIQSDLAIWLIRLEAGASLELPAARLPEALRTLYVFEGNGLQIDDSTVGNQHAVRVDASQLLPLTNTGAEAVQLLLMQGVPLNEPVAAGGPFVMNTQEELHQARVDYGRTRFGGWPWPNSAPTLGHSFQRFAKYPDTDMLELPPAS